MREVGDLFPRLCLATLLGIGFASRAPVAGENPAPSFHDIEVISDTHAYAYTYGTGEFLETTDGGHEWRLLHKFAEVYFEQVQFLNEVGWIVGSPNQVFRTMDSGRTWADLSSDDCAEMLVYGMLFDDRNNGFIACVERRDEGARTHLLRTDDSGSSWRLVQTIDETLLNLERVNGTLYATGGGRRGIILKDVDRPEAWSRVFEGDNGTGQIRDLATDGQRLIAVSFSGYVFSSRDTGWSATRITSNRLRSVAHLGGERWVVAGDANSEPRHFLWSEDGGHTWQADQRERTDIHRLGLSPSKLWLVGKNGLSETIDR